jgi:transposase
MPSRQDVRKLAPAAIQLLRHQVVGAVRGGMTQTAAAATFGASLRAVQKWVALDRAGGAPALTLQRRGRRGGHGHLAPALAQHVRQLVVERMPDQVDLPFYLWTREAVARLIEREGGVAPALTTVGRYLKAWGFTPQKPVRRAYERKDDAIAHWLATEYPAIAAQARREGATIYWGDEMGLRSDHVTGTSYAPRGRTPVVRATGQRFGCNLISAITNQGAVAFRVFQGRFTTPVFVAFLTRLLQHARGKIVLIVDGHPVHRARRVKAFVAAHGPRLRLIQLPGYCPELNPTELLNQDVKTNALGKSRPRTRPELMATIRRHLHRRQKQPHLIRHLFRERHVRYAA